MKNNQLYLSPYIRLCKNTVKNIVTGNNFECNRYVITFLKFLKQNEPLGDANLIKDFSLSEKNIDYLLRNGIVVRDKHKPNENIVVENALIAEPSTFFNLKSGNLESDLMKRKKRIGIIGIDAPSSSYIYNIGKKSYEILRDTSNELIDLSLRESFIRDYGVLINPLDQNLSYKWLSGLGNMLIGSNIFPIFIGGDHGVTYHLIEGYLENNSELAILQIDAHRDIGFCRSQYPEHGSFIKNLIDDNKKIDVYQYGIRDIESLYLSEKQDRVKVISDISELTNVNKKLYITIDVDAFSYSDIPAVSYPVPGGLHIGQFLQDIEKISNIEIVGCDIVEYNSQFDIGNMIGAVGVNYVLLGLIKYFYLRRK